MTLLKVAVDVTPLVGPPTGIHQTTRALVGALAARDDIEVTGWLLTARGAPPSIGVPVRRSRIPASLAIRGWSRAAIPPGRLVTGRADVVHGTNYLAPPTARSVISLQDMTPLRHPEWCDPEVVAMADVVRRGIRRGATLHVSSELVRHEALTEFGIEEDRVRLVHHAVAPPVGGSAEAGRGIAGGRYVLVLGRVEKRKNVAAAVRALHGVAGDIRLVIAGPAGNDEAAVATAVATHPDGRVVRLPTVSDHDRNSLVAGADALLWPSLYEGFALPPLEALLAGTPVVATATGALPELVGDEIDLVLPGDDDAFADALITTIQRGRRVDSTAADRIASHTWADAAAAMVEIYRSVASA